MSVFGARSSIVTMEKGLCFRSEVADILLLLLSGGFLTGQQELCYS